MADIQQPPTILAVNAPGIPTKMRELKRWGVWVAKWIPERGKYDKRPVHPLTGHGLSSARPHEWATFDQAFAAYHRNPTKYAGLGFVIAKGDGIFCIDLDKCMPGGVPDAKALDVINSVQTFVELSPSGQGAHLWGEGTVSHDCVKGIEVYQGNSARYVTVTGVALPQASGEWREVASTVLESVIDAYGHRSTATADHEVLPEILDSLALPEVAEMDLPYTVADFLSDGELGPRDRSLMLFQTAIALHNAGLSKQEVFSVMVNNTHAFAAAMGKRGEDEDRALTYLWEHHVVKAKPKSDTTRITAEDFDELADTGIAASESTPASPDSSGSPTDMFDDESANVPPPADKPPSKLKYEFLQAAAYSSGMKPTTWLVRGLLPKAEVGVCFGPSGAGKSFFVLDLCLAIARGERWRGKSVRKGRVAYIVAEGSRGFKLRLDAYADYHDVDLNSIDFFALPAAPNILEKAEVKELLQALKALGHLDLIVVDTVAQVTPGADENSGQDMGRMLAHCKAIHRITGAMVLLVGHTGKDESRGMRGWSGVKGALDVEMEVSRALNYRAATVTKMKDGTGEGTEYAFKLDVVTMGQETDEDGEIHDITSCVLVETAVSTAGAAPPKGANERLLIGAIEDMLDLTGATGTDIEAAVAAAAAKAPPPEAGKKDQRRKNMRRALESLVASGRLKVSGDEVSLT